MSYARIQVFLKRGAGVAKKTEMASMALITNSDQAFEHWVKTINEVCGAFSGRKLDENFCGSVQSNRNIALSLSVIEVSHAELVHSVNDIARSDKTPYYAVFQVSGEAYFHQFNEVHLSPGDIVVADSSRPFSFGYGKASRQISLTLPSQKVSQLMRHADIFTGDRIAAEVPAAKLASCLIEGAIRQEISQSDGEAVLDAVITLLRPLLVRQKDGSDWLFNRVRQVIDQCLGDESLNSENLARNVGVSRRTLYRIFKGRGLLVSQYIRNRRLDMCAESLRSLGERRNLLEVSQAWGFSNSSYFSSAFKERFGISPIEFKKRSIA